MTMDIYRYCGGSRGCYYVDALTAYDSVYCDGEYGCYRAEDISANYIHC